MGRRNSFGPLEADVWQFRCGGYPVLERWLKQRRGKPLDDRVCGDVERIVEIIRGTLRIQGSLVRCVPV